MSGFERKLKNNLVLLPQGTWDGNVTKRYELLMKKTTVKKVAAAGDTTEGVEKEKKKKTTTTTATGEKKKKSPSKGKTSSSSPTKVENTEPATSTPTTPVKKTTKLKTKASEISLKNPTEQLIDESIPELHPMPVEIPLDGLTNIEIGEQLLPLPHELFNISPVSDIESLSDDDLALGASASPTMMGPHYEFGNAGPTESDLLAATVDCGEATEKTEDEARQDLQFSNFFGRKYGGDDVPTWQRGNSTKVQTTNADFVTETETQPQPQPRNYVGLVNQAMTCYLNSLLQALYMTPEFRNALYRWEFDNDNEAKNIPYQLQKLFLNLQTSAKSSVETTDLTRSFGWDSTEAWQQHDIQELCRVMFDALEHKFKNTKQANLISTLYEGKMNDYVKCLECNTEKTREDTFLDIPLPVRPFGSSSAYGSIEEALRAFVQPETLDGNNQYLCEKCKKKCDAHKGLHFKSFPYILTLHLKRFDFDYQTMHRIKLNDR